MAKPLRSQLNQIRAWVRQGRTDAWIGHQLEVSATELREFRRRHELDDGEDDGSEVDLRDEIEAEIEAATREEELAAEQAAADPDSDEGGSDDEDAESGEAESGEAEEGADDGDEDRPPRRRRRRRGGRGRRGGATMQATFDHGDEGYGLWLDPAVGDDPVYTEHWADKRQVEVTIEPERIVIRRAGAEAGGSGSGD